MIPRPLLPLPPLLASLAFGAPGLVSGAAPVAAQSPAPELARESAATAGVVGAGLLLRRLDGEKRVLMIAAHPDDEDTALLAALAREAGARTAYLSLTRGEGGQNVIGGELGEGLGIVRSGELLAARALDGAEQYFTRAYDFGYSRAAEEAFDHWPEEELLEDVVRVVRRFRPQVIVSVFEGSPRDGHGQHQVAGILARRAFEVAGDPERFPHHQTEGVTPWSPVKLYRSTRRRPDEATVRLETGRLDPLLGRSPFQVAMEGRSLHRSQEFGSPRHPGPRSAPLILVDSRASGPRAEDGMFAGVDTTLAGLVSDNGEAAAAVVAYRRAIQEAKEALDPWEPSRAAGHLARALEALRAVGDLADTSGDEAAELTAVLDYREPLVRRALLAAAGVVVEARTDRDRAVPGDRFEVEVRVWNGGPYSLEGVDPRLALPAGWETRGLAADAGGGGSPGFFFGGVEGRVVEGTTTVGPDELVRWRFSVRLPDDVAPTREYYLARPRDGALYRWPDDPELRGLPRTPPRLGAVVDLTAELPESGPVSLEARPRVEYVGVHRITGEYREPFLVVPRLSVSLEPDWLLWPVERDDAGTVTLRVRGEADGEIGGTARLEAPEGWRVEPARSEFRVGDGTREAELAFRLAPEGGVEAGRGEIRAVVRDDSGRSYREGMELVDYPHIDRVPLYRPAAVDLTAASVRVREGLRVGYVMGSGDDGVEALRQMGAQVELLGPEELRSGDLDRFDTLVLGVRAYEVRPDLVAANGRVLDFARRGGTVVVQYHKYEYPDGDFAPYPVSIARPHDRVTDPGAPVSFLHPDSPALTTPNRITDEDFEGWVQERGLYFLREWDPAFTPLLEMRDPGLDPVRGALVVAPVGEGLYVYTGLAFFRQFPAGVPGAFRLFANLVSLTAPQWAEHHE